MSEEEILGEINATEAELQSVLYQQRKSDRAYSEALQTLRETHLLETELAQSLNCMDLDNKELQDEILSLDNDIERTSDTLSKYMQMNSLNDVFHIWYAGPYGTITNFRLGNIPIKPIDSNEINAALGQAALLVDTIADKLGYAFKSFNIMPMGSFARICKLDAKKQIFPLHLEASGYLLYPKWYFNQAMIGFMTCIIELGEVCGEKDPTLSMPYKISISDNKIGDVRAVILKNIIKLFSNTIIGFYLFYALFLLYVGVLYLWHRRRELDESHEVHALQHQVARRLGHQARAGLCDIIDYLWNEGYVLHAWVSLSL